jgi:zinc/manganese transport system substrate-binding protein
MTTILSSTIALVACSHNAGTMTSGRATRGRNDVTVATPIQVTTTISTLNSFVQGVGGKYVSVQSIVPVGASPETFEPTPQSVVLVSQARLLVENGAGLETWMHGLLQDATAKATIVVASQGLPVKGSNPHLWMDPVYAKHYVARIRDALVSIDPAHRTYYLQHAASYDAQLDALIAWIRAQLAPIPKPRRLLIVFHNAWQYYDDRFGIRTLGIIEVAPGQEPNPHDFGHVVDLAKQYHVGAIFGEPEYSPKLALALARDAGVPVVENLYDDSIGTSPQVDNYISMLRYDTRQLVKSMR